MVSCAKTTTIYFASPKNKQQTYEVVLMGGQSNMTGYGNVNELSKIRFENISFVDKGLNDKQMKPKNKFGMEVGLAMQLEKHFPERKFILIKYAIGGSSLLDWSPEYNKEKAKITGHREFGNMYQKMLHLKDSVTNGLNTKIIALLWMQGERDARIPEAGKDYYENFKRLITALRKDVKQEKLPVIFGKVNPPPQKFPALKIVVTAQQKIDAEVNQAFLIETDGLPKHKDRLHYNSNGQLALGKRFGKKLTELLKKRKTDERK